MVKLTTFAVMCKAYGGKPSVDLLRSFLNLSPAGNWLTLSYKGASGIPSTLTKPITHLERWKGSFFFIEKKIISSKYPQLLLEDNKLDKKSFKDKIPTHPQEDPLILGISPSTKSVNNEAPIIQAELITTIPPSGLVENIDDFDDALSNQDDVVPPPASKTTGVASKPLNMDNDPDIHEFLTAKELKEAVDCHFVVANVTPPSLKNYLKEISLKKLCDIHDRVYMRQVVLDNTLNRRTRKLMSALSKAQTSCDIVGT
ncbi:hypothetical protein Tco_0759093 [Tanacetum coccineum]